MDTKIGIDFFFVFCHCKNKYESWMLKRLNGGIACWNIAAWQKSDHQQFSPYSENNEKSVDDGIPVIQAPVCRCQKI